MGCIAYYFNMNVIEPCVTCAHNLSGIEGLPFFIQSSIWALAVSLWDALHNPSSPSARLLFATCVGKKLNEIERVVVFN